VDTQRTWRRKNHAVSGREADKTRKKRGEEGGKIEGEKRVETKGAIKGK